LINFTGFRDDGEEGLKKTTDYYNSWLNFLGTLDNRYTVICDRIFLSEMVYSSIYKQYDFSEQFEILMNDLTTQNHNILLFLFTVDFTVNDVEIYNRIIREKAPLFSQVLDDIYNIIKQQESYIELYEEIKKKEYININSYIVDTTMKSIDDVYEEVLNKI
jgi:deoxyguanosine kinase